MTEYVNLYAYESSYKSELLEVCHKYNIPRDRIFLEQLHILFRCS